MHSKSKTLDDIRELHRNFGTDKKQGRESAVSRWLQRWWGVEAAPSRRATEAHGWRSRSESED